LELDHQRIAQIKAKFSETVQREFKIPLYTEGPPHEPWFISEAADEGYIVEPQKKSVAIYAMGEKKL